MVARRCACILFEAVFRCLLLSLQMRRSDPPDHRVDTSITFDPLGQKHRGAALPTTASLPPEGRGRSVYYHGSMFYPLSCTSTSGTGPRTSSAGFAINTVADASRKMIARLQQNHHSISRQGTYPLSYTRITGIGAQTSSAGFAINMVADASRKKIIRPQQNHPSTSQ